MTSISVVVPCRPRFSSPPIQTRLPPSGSRRRPSSWRPSSSASSPSCWSSSRRTSWGTPTPTPVRVSPLHTVSQRRTNPPAYPLRFVSPCCWPVRSRTAQQRLGIQVHRLLITSTCVPPQSGGRSAPSRSVSGRRTASGSSTPRATCRPSASHRSLALWWCGGGACPVPVSHCHQMSVPFLCPQVRYPSTTKRSHTKATESPSVHHNTLSVFFSRLGGLCWEPISLRPDISLH